MEQKLKAQPRSEKGKGAARQIRAKGGVPAVLYGRGIDPVSISVDSRELSQALHTDAGMNVLIDLDIEGADNHLVLARELQQDHVRARLVHVDFLAISRDEKITVTVPIQVIGEEQSPGIHEGGAVESHSWEVEVECLPGDVPENVVADVSAVSLGESLYVRDLKAQDGVDVKSDPEDLVLAVVVPQELKVEADLEVAGEGVEGVEGEVAEGAEGEAVEGAEGAEAGAGETGGGDAEGSSE